MVTRMINQGVQTRHTLLSRARQGNDERAWHELVHHYRRFIYHILHELKVAPDDIEDISQQILVTLIKDLPSYDRTRAKFRSWFGTVIRNAALAHFRKQRTRRNYMQRFAQEKTFDEERNLPEISRMIEDEWSTYIANMAMDRVRPLFKGQALKVFKLGLEGRPVEEISKLTGLTRASVYTLKKRVKKRLYLEIRAISYELEA